MNFPKFWAKGDDGSFSCWRRAFSENYLANPKPLHLPRRKSTPSPKSRNGRAPILNGAGAFTEPARDSASSRCKARSHPTPPRPTACSPHSTPIRSTGNSVKYKNVTAPVSRPNPGAAGCGEIPPAGPGWTRKRKVNLKNGSPNMNRLPPIGRPASSFAKSATPSSTPKLKPLCSFTTTPPAPPQNFRWLNYRSFFSRKRSTKLTKPAACSSSRFSDSAWLNFPAPSTMLRIPGRKTRSGKTNALR
jgi:hypothetical protein